VTGAISFLIGYPDVDHSRINGTVPKRPLHFREINVLTNHVCCQAMLQHVRMAHMAWQTRLVSYLPEYPIELRAGEMAALLRDKQSIPTVRGPHRKPLS